MNVLYGSNLFDTSIRGPLFLALGRLCKYDNFYETICSLCLPAFCLCIMLTLQYKNSLSKFK